MKKWKTIELTLVALFVALMAVGANITSFLVIGGVPITLQAFFSILAGLLLGKRLGSFAMIVYALIGLIGLPIFSGFSGGLGVLIKPSFGFILAFILSAYVAGIMVEKKQSVQVFVFSAFVALVINYIIGTNWMYAAYRFWTGAPEGFTYSVTWSWMIFPFIKDIIFTIIAGIVAFRLRANSFIKGSLKQLT